MSAPALWIFLPLGLAAVLLLVRNQRLVQITASLFTLFLTLVAWLLPIDTLFSIGSFAFKLTPSFAVLGRNLTLAASDRSLLALIYGSAFLWYLSSTPLKINRPFIPFGLSITALLVAALAVEPFLYASLLIEMAVLLSIPILTIPGQKPARGVIRFLIFQTLAVPFILFSGWLLAGIEANPGNLALVQQAAILLGMGFAFLLAIFPFNTWMAPLAEAAHPLITGFLLWMIPTAALFFGLKFLDRYTWLREAAELPRILSISGILMVSVGGLAAAFQNHLGRIFGYAIMLETGFSLLALSLGGASGMNMFLLLLVPRSLCLLVWTFSLSILRQQAPGLSLREVKGLAHAWPFATAGLVMANLALAGLPLLAGFPTHAAIWEGLTHVSLPFAFLALTGSLGLLAGGVRVLASLVSAPEGTLWGGRETPFQRLLVLIGLFILLLLGLFPQWVLPLWTRLPAIFEHLGQ
jgi:NADH-quinone oxidoreductase subunit N